MALRRLLPSRSSSNTTTIMLRLPKLPRLSSPPKLQPSNPSTIRKWIIRRTSSLYRREPGRPGEWRATRVRWGLIQ